MAPIRSTKFGFDSLFADKVETDNNFIAIGATHTADDAFEPGNGYRYLVFTSSGNLYVNKSGRVDILVVGGGGAGGNGEQRPSPAQYYAGGGGGAGGYYETMAFNLPVGDYDISIGAGGAVSSGPFNLLPGPNRNGSPGTPTYISGPTITTITAYGGGGGAGSFDTPPNKGVGTGSDGGSGGGGVNNQTAGIGNRTTATAPATGSSIPAYLQGHDRVQGHPGNENPTLVISAGGGGGAGSAGYLNADGTIAPSLTSGGDGRPAWSDDPGIPPTYGTPGPTPGRWFAGGGGGGTNGGFDNGGTGGGGRGGDSYPSAVSDGSAGTTNTGGGGGGGSGSSRGGYAGGSGIVILRYKI